MARPKKTPDKAKSTYFRFRCTEDEKAAIDAAAASCSLDGSAWARYELLKLARKALEKERAGRSD